MSSDDDRGQRQLEKIPVYRRPLRSPWPRDSWCWWVGD